MKEYSILTQGGPLDGETRSVPDNVLRWPPPVNLPGVFHGGVYIRHEFNDFPKRLATYWWAEYKKGEDVFVS